MVERLLVVIPASANLSCQVLGMALTKALQILMSVMTEVLVGAPGRRGSIRLCIQRYPMNFLGESEGGCGRCVSPRNEYCKHCQGR